MAGKARSPLFLNLVTGTGSMSADLSDLEGHENQMLRDQQDLMEPTHKGM